MILATVAVIGLSLAYLLQMEYWRKLWLNEPIFEAETTIEEVRVSVIIPYRNEETNLKQLLDSLASQTYGNWELILVNDHSEDNGELICKQYQSKIPVTVHLLNNTRHGKKEALKMGALKANYELLVTSDADCILQPNWLKTISHFYQKTKADLIIGGVQLFSSNNKLGQFQVMEMAALQLSGAAAAISGKPIMMNGANMACTKAFYLKAKLKTELASGDDMFLLEEAKRYNMKINYLKSPESIVYSSVQKSFAQMLSQKARWAAKAKSYSDKHIIKIGVLTFAMNLCLFALIIGSFISPTISVFLLGLIVIKLIADVRLLNSAYGYFAYPICVKELLIGQLLYPFYMLLVLIYPIFKPLKWKNRKV
ncbi:glycosyltransferase [Carboxylicivirga sp. N1Y90]|uniref:glycosyltransferase n=1 Tax=Carboxylicivirga fragile TaxID=3417571 RepID=UPI003D32D49E|nr:glycosyltransferase [Marinilabiliaceae bacterium N1Y90]